MYPYTLEEYCALYEKFLHAGKKENVDSERIYRNMNLKRVEMDDFYNFCLKVREVLPHSFNSNGWFLGTLLPPFPDFDSLLFSKKQIIDVELKHKIDSQNEYGIIKKFKKQRHLLELIKDKFKCFSQNTQIYYYVYIVEENRLLEFDLEKDRFWKLSFKQLARRLEDIKNPLTQNPINKLQRRDFLISPLDNIDSFKKGQYYLSEEQEIIKEEILKTNGKGIFGIEGSAGSGKSLIAYDLVKRLSDKKILFIFPGKLKEKHEKFRENYPFVQFSSGKELSVDLLNKHEIIIIDEAQRLYYKQPDSALNILKTWIESNYKSKQIIFFYDSHQALGPKDCGNLINSMFNGYSKDGKGKMFKLPNSIRSNPEICAFVNRLLDLNKKPKRNITVEMLKRHVEVKFFNSADQAQEWIQYLQQQGFIFLIPTGSKYKPASSDKFAGLFSISRNTHEILGEEHENIVTYIDNSFQYDQHGVLKCVDNSNYYYLDNELYVNLTRARENLAICVIENVDIYLAIINVIFGDIGSKFELERYVQKCKSKKDLESLKKMIEKREQLIK